MFESKYDLDLFCEVASKEQHNSPLIKGGMDPDTIKKLSLQSIPLASDDAAFRFSIKLSNIMKSYTHGWRILDARDLSDILHENKLYPAGLHINAFIKAEFKVHIGTVLTGIIKRHAFFLSSSLRCLDDSKVLISDEIDKYFESESRGLSSADLQGELGELSSLFSDNKIQLSWQIENGIEVKDYPLGEILKSTSAYVEFLKEGVLVSYLGTFDRCTIK